MPISATGSRFDHGGGSAKGSTVVRNTGDSGFTLIELMVVITIIALASAVVVLAFPNRNDEVRKAAMRFAVHASAARDAAIIDGRDTRLRLDATGYQVEQRRRGIWQALTGKAGQRIDWPQGLTIGGLDVLTFDSTGGAMPAVLVLQGARVREGVTIDARGTVRVTP